jgi:membrane protein implicated in regulation of membrane protease activity
MLGSLLRSLLKVGVAYGLSELFLREQKLKHTTQAIFIAAFLLILSLLLAYLAFAALLVGLFLYLANFSELVRPALLTALLAGLVAALLIWEAVRRVKKRAG